MNWQMLPAWQGLAIQCALGIAVFRANPKGRVNQSFLVVCLCIVAWLASLLFAFDASTSLEAEFWIRNASACGILMVNAFNFLRLAIVGREREWGEIARNSRGLAVASAAGIALCYTPLFLHSAALRPEAVPQPLYGPLGPLYLLFLISTFAAVVFLYLRDLKRSSGVAKVELGFVVVGLVALLLLSVLGVLLLPVLPQAVTVQLAPFRAVIFSLIIAYGVATRKIMDVGLVIRRILSYTVLTAYLLVLYGAIWWLVSKIAPPLLGDSARTFAHLVAAIVIAFAMAPARGLSSGLANRLFLGTRRIDFHGTMRKATDILRDITTLAELLEKFATTIADAVRTDRLYILLPSANGYTQHYPPVGSANRSQPITFASESGIIAYLKTPQDPIVLDELRRTRLTPELESVAHEMESLQVVLAMAIFSREHLAGVMLLGPRISGRIYGRTEQEALQVLSGQLAVAIDNARLFTEVQNAKLYNETLLENLTSGVIAVGADERVTVFNNEAGQITDLRPREILDGPMDGLPAPISAALRETLRSGVAQENREISVRSGDEEVVVRASSAIFHGQEGEMLGALMVVTDITALKRLEQQIRRSDRLVSLGTLSAGMAHEIKNPLVSIKTFSQLLPERYQDSDFRETFSNLIGHEIDRIDSLVNQLLRFARPAKPLLRTMHLHEVLEKSLMLVGHELYQKEIKLSRVWKAEVDTIRADADQLEQVFLNFFLNAMDAMKQGGELQVATEIVTAEEWMAPVTSRNTEVTEILRVTVRDNGEGIKNEDIPHVFDPFFTTKDYGTGLGLSVVHGIIEEHGGQIEVESELEKGTAFHILLPLVRLREEVAAA